MLPVIVTYANTGYLHFAKNLLENFLQKVHHHSLHFFCLDSNIYKVLKEDYGHHPRFIFELFDVDVSQSFESYGTITYNLLTHTKVKVLTKALGLYPFIHFIDCDVVCVKEPAAEYYEQYKDKDIVFQFDCGLGHGHGLFNNWVCTGNMLLRNTLGTFYILSQIETFQERHADKNDQDCLKAYFDSKGIIDIHEEPCACLWVFPIEEYTNGWMIKHRAMDTSKTYFFHANHVRGDAEKIGLLKQIGFWLV